MSGNGPPDNSGEKSPLLGEGQSSMSNLGSSRNHSTSKGISLTKNKLLVIICILLCELCERLTYYSVVANLVLYCTSKLDMSSSSGTTASLVFSGTVYIIPVVGGYIADTVSGKYNAILGSGLLYIIGLFLLPASAIDYGKWFGKDSDGKDYSLNIDTKRGFYFGGLCFIALGTGGIKANVSPFGAQQIDEMGPDALRTFFNWFYWFINAGALIAYSAVAYIQQNISFEIGFLVPLLSMIVALILFVVAKKHYIVSEPGGSIIEDSVGVCFSTRCRSFDLARQKYSSEFVDGVIAVLRILPVFLTIIIYWAVYSQMNSSFFLQSERMDIYIGELKMPVAVLNVFNSLIILILIPIMDRIVYPGLARCNIHPTHLHRIGFGFVLAALSVAVAGILEIYRKKDLAQTGGIRQELAGDYFNASTISFLAQVPQFALVGASEVFASISGLEFAYSQAPEFMQGLCTGLFWMSSGLGNYVSELILRLVRAATGSQPPDSWYPDEINEGKTEYLFFLISIIMAIDFLVFIVVAKYYKYRRPPDSTDTLDTIHPSKDDSLKEGLLGTPKTQVLIFHKDGVSNDELTSEV